MNQACLDQILLLRIPPSLSTCFVLHPSCNFFSRFVPVRCCSVLCWKSNVPFREAPTNSVSVLFIFSSLMYLTHLCVKLMHWSWWGFMIISVLVNYNVRQCVAGFRTKSDSTRSSLGGSSSLEIYRLATLRLIVKDVNFRPQIEIEHFSSCQTSSHIPDQAGTLTINFDPISTIRASN